MKYIKVTNKVKEVNRLGLEKLGLSTKRDNDETIGQFGSGIKFAPIAAIRKGMDWAFVGSDNKGDYILKYVIKEDDGIPCVFYDYGDYEKPSSFTAEAGLLSWTNDFQIYREVVSNAIDESRISGLAWSIDIIDVEEIIHCPGEFSVYFTATEEMMRIHENFAKYFSVNRYALYSDGNFKLYNHIDDTFRVYVKGVLVYSDEKAAENIGRETMYGIFDYEFDNLELNEERTIASSWDMGMEIVRCWTKLDDKNLIKKVLEAMVNADIENYFEFDSIATHVFNYGITGELWKETFDELYPNHVLIKTLESSVNAIKTIESKGYKPFQIDHEGIYTFLLNRGITTAQSVFGESFKYEYSMDINGFSKLNQAIKIIETVVPTINFDYIVGVYTEEDEDITCNGLTLELPDEVDPTHMNKTILINREFAENETIVKIMSTLVHEWDHYSKGIGDGNMEGRMFREVADSRMGELILQIFKITNGSESIV
jgi:hypothetical protein